MTIFQGQNMPKIGLNMAQIQFQLPNMPKIVYTIVFHGIPGFANKKIDFGQNLAIFWSNLLFWTFKRDFLPPLNFIVRRKDTSHKAKNWHTCSICIGLQNIVSDQRYSVPFLRFRFLNDQLSPKMVIFDHLGANQHFYP